ncbi:MAG TPA: hypothetical protein VFN94_04155 [Nitrospiria bacterium]|nr:hypothetical protein [Nitrospiria bacterium]
MRAITVFLLVGVLWHADPVLAKNAGDHTVDPDRTSEERDLSRLAHVQADPANTIAEFTTDGCSGGLSDGWVTLSRVLPAFRSAFGDRPPYEFCCTTHDRAYWRGETEHGYAKRLEADETLRRCVIDYGTQHRAEFAERFRLPEDTIVTNFQAIGDLMYLAVRAGGKPCSSFPWRWGYGWPKCP